MLELLATTMILIGTICLVLAIASYLFIWICCFVLCLGEIFNSIKLN